MIGTDEMSSTGMDISESFRPEDISKTDFFDFVTAPDMGIGLGVNVNLHHSHHNNHHQQQQQQQQQHHQHHHPQHHTQQQPQPPLTMTQQHHHNNNTHPHHGSQHQQQHNSSNSRSMTHDGGGGGGGNGVGNGGGGSGGSIGTSGDSHNDASGLSDGSSASTTDPTLHGYEFWTSDKEHTSTIFEDLDRYCWQQQSTTNASANNSSASVMHHTSPANTLNPLHSNSVNPSSPHNHHSPATPVTTPTSLTSTPVPQTQLNSDGTISNIISTDGQIYTLTVLNGNEPWLKRDTDNQLSSSLDLDSLLGTFPGYIKSEYPYDDSGFSTDGCKDVNTSAENVMNNSTNSGGSVGVGVNNQRLPSLINTISVSSSGGGGGNGNVSNANDSVSTALSIGQQLDQFHNNNNDWHMTDHNNEQNSAESLLRSALQGKGYAKGLHMHNGITLMSTSPTVKDDEMRRILFPVDTDGLNFSDTSLSAAQIFDDTQTANGHNPHMVVPHSPVTNGPLTPVTNNPNTNNNSNNNQSTSLIVDDMFLTLENAFSDDFEKIKQFCTAGSNTNDYGTNDVMMQISPNGSGTVQQATSPTASSIQAVTTTHQPMLTSLHAAGISTTTTPNNGCRQPTTVGGMPATLTQQQQPPPQPLKPEVTTSTQRIASTAKVTKKYKRTLAPAHHNNNNPNVINHNNNNNNSSNTTNINKLSSNNMTLPNGQNRNANNTSSSSSTNSSNSPTHCNGMLGGNVGVIGGNNTTTSSNNTSSTNNSSSSSSSSSTPGQRKERSLHYCSICSKGFKDKYSVNVHIRTHTGEKPFACTLCGKSFRQKAHLAKHYQTHMAQKNNGSLVKGSSGKHHRSSASQSLNTSAIGAHSHNRSLSIANAPNTPTSLGGPSVVGGLVSGILSSSGLPSLGVPVSAATAPTTPPTILPPANGLLANR
ncbi:uncharacterized protein ACRADG_001318 isoform 1-T3 [Cochliomyia hominivorax]